MNYLLKGDISGIQEFIFNVQSKGAAKTLKARSYYVQILGYAACKLTLQKLDVEKEFYEGGGSFFIEFEAKNDDEASKKVKSIQDTINQFQKEEDLLIRLAFVPIGSDGFEKAWLKLRKESNKQKQKFFGNHHPYFRPFEKTDTEKEAEKFPQAKKWIKKISELPENNLYEALTNIMVKKQTILTNLLGITFTEENARFDGALINKLPFWENYEEITAYKKYRETNKSLYAGDDELDGENIIDFDALGDFAQYRTGTNKLGILKLDVDNLGQLFGASNEQNAKEYSKSFSEFFTRTIYEGLFASQSFGLNDIQEEAYRANIYPIFTGGDDCFIIGGWDAILCFTKDLHELFVHDSMLSKIRLDNKPISFSAGIVLVNPTHPVRHFVELAESALTKAKADGKNKICVFDLTFSWADYKHILATSKLLAVEMITENISRAYLDKIRKSARGFNALQNRDGADFDKIYKLRYYLSKKDNKLDKVVEALFDPYYENLKSRLLDKNYRATYDVAIYPAIARVTEFLTKSKLKYETHSE